MSYSKDIFSEDVVGELLLDIFGVNKMKFQRSSLNNRQTLQNGL